MRNELTIEDNYYITLQPICDSGMRHIADEVLYRPSKTLVFSKIDNHLITTTRVVNTAFLENSLKKLVGNRKLFFNAPKEWILKPELLPPYPNQIVIKVLKNLISEPEVITALKEIHNLGYNIAFDGFILNDATRPLLNIASIIKIDVFEPIVEENIAEYKQHGIRLLAKKVDNLATFNHFKSIGFDMFKGCFYTHPEIYTENSTYHKNNNIHIRIISELQLEEPSFELLEKLITQESQLSFMLLNYVNSLILDSKNEINTIYQALKTLDLDKTCNIVTTIILANNSPASRILLPKALTRAYMCQNLAEKTRDLDSRSGFILGLVSMMDLLMNIDLVELIEELPLTLEIKEALTLGKGNLGELLNLVIAFEEAKVDSRSPELISRLNDTWLASQKLSNEVINTVVY